MLHNGLIKVRWDSDFRLSMVEVHGGFLPAAPVVLRNYPCKRRVLVRLVAAPPSALMPETCTQHQEAAD